MGFLKRGGQVHWCVNEINAHVKNANIKNELQHTKDFAITHIPNNGILDTWSRHFGEEYMKRNDIQNETILKEVSGEVRLYQYDIRYRPKYTYAISLG